MIFLLFLNCARKWDANGLFQGKQRLSNIDTPFLFGVGGALAFLFCFFRLVLYGILSSEYEYKTLTKDVDYFGLTALAKFDVHSCEISRAVFSTSPRRRACGWPHHHCSLFVPLSRTFSVTKSAPPPPLLRHCCETFLSLVSGVYSRPPRMVALSE